LGEGERAFSTGRWGGGGVCVSWSKQKRAARGVRLSESGSGFYWICFTEKRGIACDVGLLLETMETAPSSSMAQRRGSRRRSTATPNHTPRSIVHRNALRQNMTGWHHFTSSLFRFGQEERTVLKNSLLLATAGR